MIINDQDGLYLYKHSNYIVDTAYFNDEDMLQFLCSTAAAWKIWLENLYKSSCFSQYWYCSDGSVLGDSS